MAKKLFFGSVCAISLMKTLSAVYAPIPELERGQDFTTYLNVGGYYDTNIFGSASDREKSYVADTSAELHYNKSLTDQTFFEAMYRVQFLYFENRPSDDTQINHIGELQLDHSFRENLSLVLSEEFGFIDNPESAVVANVLQQDQSFFRNRAKISLNWAFSEKFDLVNKYRNTYYDYDNAVLQTQLGRVEHLYGLELGYKASRAKLIGEYRFQLNDYDSDVVAKDSTSNFLLGGVNYQMQEKLNIEARAGIEFRDRDNRSNTEDPFVQVTARYNYAERSYLTSALSYRLKESSDTVLFNDKESAELLIGCEHFITSQIALSGNFTHEVSTLQGRSGVSPDQDEDTTRLGLAISYLPSARMTFSGSYDYDYVDSDVASRDQVRSRFSLTARFVF